MVRKRKGCFGCVKLLSEKILEAFFKAVFPTRCLICGRFFDRPNMPIGSLSFPDVMAPFLCQACACDFTVVESPKCSICGFMFVSREGEDHACAKCVKAPLAFGKARAYGLYDRSLQEAIHLLKYRRKTYLAGALGDLLFRVFTENWEPGEIDVVVPVPLHGGRLRKRGFNQTYQLIRNWSDRLHGTEPGLARPIVVSQDVLVRTRGTKSQVGMTRKERLKNIKGVFRVRDPLAVKGKNVLLVDDVFTTGATADECAKTLFRSGAAGVDVLTLSQTERNLQ